MAYVRKNAAKLTPDERRRFVNALCLWCCLAWAATILLFWYVASFVVRTGFLPAPDPVKNFLAEFTWVLPVLHIGVVGMLILTRWWDFWTS